MKNITETWKQVSPSVCSITHYDEKDKKISSGSGFKVGDYIVTNSHVGCCEQAKKTKIEFPGDIDWKSSYDNFHSSIADVMTPDEWDFAVYRTENMKEFSHIPSLELAPKDIQIDIGQKVALLGYPFGKNNLSIHAGYIS